MAQILMIDDDLDVLDMLRTFLVRDGHQIDCVDHSSEGLRLAKEWNYDLVIIDLFMPGKDGMEILLDLKACRLDLKVIVMSSGGRYAQTVLLDHVNHLGADRTFYKGDDPAVLGSLVSQLLGARTASIFSPASNGMRLEWS